jgi:hypothetical protein
MNKIATAFTLSLFLIVCCCLFCTTPESKKNNQIEIPWKSIEDFKKAEPEIKRKIKWLSENPLSSFSKDTARLITLWAIKVPYRTFKTDLGPLSEYLNDSKNYPYSPEITSQYMFGTVEYVLNNASNDSILVIKAGFQSMITAYKKIRSEKTDAENKILDSYEKMLAENTIEGYIKNYFLSSFNKKQ